MMSAPQTLPFVTADLPGTGGAVKLEPSDFEVEEVPAYEPCGTGDHLFLWIEKRAVSAEGLLRHVARSLGIARAEVGCAGLKDAQAVTRQFVSVPASTEPNVSEIDTPEIRVLRAARHRNKLKTGHLRGNRFRIVVRDVAPDALAHAAAVRDRLCVTGLPNFYGPQRFGIGEETLAIGRAILRGEAPEALARARGSRKFLRRLALSSVQADLFNRCLAERLRDGLLHRVLEGDVMQVCASGGPFVAADIEREQARFDAREIVPAGPIFGPKMLPARCQAAEREQAVLSAAGLTLRDFAAQGKLMRGTRRPNLVWVDELEVAPFDNALQFRFQLPRGSYATVLINEFVKADELAFKAVEAESN
jgi:tRNA pseudouridine13 synthase